MPTAGARDPTDQLRQRRNLHPRGTQASAGSAAGIVYNCKPALPQMPSTNCSLPMQFGRPDASKAVFLITDGYSNGGDPRPTAELLKQMEVEFFTFGIRYTVLGWGKSGVV